MTYENLKSLVKALLTGDNVLPTDQDQVLMMLSYAFDKVANEADALKLFTINTDGEKIIRNGPGRTFLRKPKLPTSDSDELDIDDEIGFPVARYMASFLSREKGGIHVREAQALIRAYNQKIETYFESLSKDGELSIYDEEDQFGKRTYP